MALNLDKTPFPYFGGKADASPHVWTALGDVDHYVEPFFGSGAVLIRRPHEANRTYYSETVNDLDGLLVNFWRALQAEPDALAEAASWPVSEIDLMARQIALVKWRDERMPDVLRADAHAYDVQMAGWWVWGLSAWIGTGWCGPGPWRVGDDGRVTRDAKQGGVKGQLPHLADNGKGVHHAGLRQGVRSKLPDLTTNGRGVLRPQLRDDAADEITMPKLREWLRHLAARLRHVRILHGDWTRAVTTGAAHTLPVRQGGVCGYFLDPPYSADADRDAGMYAQDSLTIAHDVREWCLANGGNPKNRIVLAGYDGEHNALEGHGWRAVEWYKSGFLKGGMGNLAGTSQQHRERLWLSPHCLGVKASAQASLFG